MNRKAFTLSIFMAIFAVFMVESYVSSLEETARKKYGTEVTVLVAKRDIKEMETIDESMIDQTSLPKSFVEKNAVFFEGNLRSDQQKSEARERRQSLAGFVALVPIKRGEQITSNKVTEPSIRTGLSPQVTPGRRAYTMPVSDVSGVAKLVKPGDRVDLIAVIDPGFGKENKLSKVILQDVVVLATGHSVTNNAPRVFEQDTFSGKERIRSLTEDSSFGTVTVEVEPAQAQELALLLASGDSVLSLALRNNDDTERVNTAATMLFDVLGTDGNRIRRPAGR